MIEKAPIIFTPYLKTVIWGGNKICRYKGIPQTGDKIGESWEISAVPGHESIVAEGIYSGKSITDLIDMFGAELLGGKVCERFNGKFPLLIKFIDAADNLSVQVHPDDELARKRHNSLGKTEMWYIIQTDENAEIYAGLKEEMTPCEYVAHVADDTFADMLAVHQSRPGDVFFLPAGRVHAIGAGNLLAEIQESSDITYRIYDYNRVGADGKPRQLHTMLAKDAIDYKVYPDYKCRPQGLDQTVAGLVRCDHFTTDRISLDGMVSLELDPSSFTVMICIEGDFKVKYHDGEMNIRAGQTALIPAALSEIILEGKSTILTTHL